MTTDASNETFLPSAADSRLSIQIEADVTTGYAGVQNNIPIVRAVVVKNVGLTDWVAILCAPRT